MLAPAETVDTTTFVRGRMAALLEIPGFENVVATWLQALVRLTLASRGASRRVYLSAVADLLHATEDALSMLPAGWARALSPERSPNWASRPSPYRPSGAAVLRDEQLTPREREVVALIARGCTNKQIAAALVVSGATAERHVANILSKLGLRSRVDVAIWSLGPTDSAA
jgi:DNA-binding NarL/FixJ family response regulator